MAEQMRQTDRQLSNIEAMPEGFNRLRQLYETVQVEKIGRRVGPDGCCPILRCSIIADDANAPSCLMRPCPYIILAALLIPPSPRSP